MKTLALLLTLMGSLSTFATTIKHYNCEAHVNYMGLFAFVHESQVSQSDFEATLKLKGFTSIQYYEGSIKDQFGSNIAETLLDVALVQKLESPYGSFARYDINEYVGILGTNIGVNKLESLTVTGKKGFFETKKKFAYKLGLELLKQLPNCEVE
jgi:hypothetical protein